MMERRELLLHVHRVKSRKCRENAGSIRSKLERTIDTRRPRGNSLRRSTNGDDAAMKLTFHNID